MVIPYWFDSSLLSQLEEQLQKAPLLKMVSNAVMERLSSPFVWTPLLFIIISMLYSRLTARLPLPAELPWIGKNSTKIFAETRAHLTSFNNVRQWLNEGYNKVWSYVLNHTSLLTQPVHSSLAMARHTYSLISLESQKSSFQVQRCGGFLTRYDCT
jgi:hypothetical protein